jgi:hypothetical protein
LVWMLLELQWFNLIRQLLGLKGQGLGVAKLVVKPAHVVPPIRDSKMHR